MVVVRFFNTVGPRQTSRYGMVLPTFVRQALAGEPITVFGDGHQSRSFTYVGDVVGALLKLMVEPKAIGMVINIGNPQEISIGELADEETMTRSSSPIVLVLRTTRPTMRGSKMLRRVRADLAVPRAICYSHRLSADRRLDEIIERVIADARREIHSLANLV